MPPPPTESTRHGLVLGAVLRALRPLVRLLLRHGVTYPELSAALKPVFVEAARAELQQHGMAVTDSAVTLLCGVHRKDVRELTRGTPARAAQGVPGDDAATDAAPPLSLTGEVIGAWLGQAAWHSEDGTPRALDRGEFEQLAASVSRDVRPRALREEMARLGVVEEDPEGRLRLLKNGFAPRAGLPEMARLMADNVGDHAAAAAANLLGEENFLEQAMYVDRLSAASVARVRQAARQAWAVALRRVLAEAQARFEADESEPDAEAQARRTHRARFGVYFYCEEGPRP